MGLHWSIKYSHVLKSECSKPLNTFSSTSENTHSCIRKIDFDAPVSISQIFLSLRNHEKDIISSQTHPTYWNSICVQGASYCKLSKVFLAFFTRKMQFLSFNFLQNYSWMQARMWGMIFIFFSFKNVQHSWPPGLIIYGIFLIFRIKPFRQMKKKDFSPQDLLGHLGTHCHFLATQLGCIQVTQGITQWYHLFLACRMGTLPSHSHPMHLAPLWHLQTSMSPRKTFSKCFRNTRKDEPVMR